MGGINPNIALSYQPPQFTVQPASPVQQMGQVLTLQNLMTQGQMSQLELQQKQEEWRQMQGLYQELANATQQQRPSGSNLFQPVSPAPSSNNLFQPIAPTPVATPMQAPPGFDNALAGYAAGPYTVVPPPALAQPPSAPAADTGPPAAPAPEPGTLAAGMAATPAAAPTLDYAGMYQRYPLAAAKFVPQIAAMVKTGLENQKLQQETAFNAVKDAGSILQGISPNDNSSVMTAVRKLAEKGYISWPQARSWATLPPNAPIFEEMRNQALTGAEFHAARLADIKAAQEAETHAHEKAMYPSQENEAQSKAIKAALETVPGYVKGQEKSAELSAEMKAYEPIRQMVASGQWKLQDLPQAIQEKILPGLAQPASPGTPDAGGATPAPYTLLNKRISDEELQRLTELNNAENQLKETQNYLMNGKVATPWLGTDSSVRTYMGKPSIALQHLPLGIGDPMQKIAGHLALTKQQLKNFVTNKSLRGLTPEGLDEMFPTISKSPSVNDENIATLLKSVQTERAQYVKDLIAAGKLLPSGEVPSNRAAPTPAPASAGAATPSAGGTNYQSPVKITLQGETPAAAGQTAAPQTPPNRVHVRKPDGTTGYIPADQLPAAKKALYVEIP